MENFFSEDTKIQFLAKFSDQIWKFLYQNASLELLFHICKNEKNLFFDLSQKSETSLSRVRSFQLSLYDTLSKKVAARGIGIPNVKFACGFNFDESDYY